MGGSLWLTVSECYTSVILFIDSEIIVILQFSLLKVLSLLSEQIVHIYLGHRREKNSINLLPFTNDLWCSSSFSMKSCEFFQTNTRLFIMNCHFFINKLNSFMFPGIIILFSFFSGISFFPDSFITKQY